MTANINYQNHIDCESGRGRSYLEQYVDNQDIEYIFQRVHNTVEHCFQLGHPFDRLERTEDSQHAEGLDSAEVLPCGAPAAEYNLHFIT